MDIIKYNNKDFKIHFEGNNKFPPFQNDHFMMSMMLKELESSDIFIETGSYLGNTIYFVGVNFPRLKCYTCELQQNFFEIAQRKLKNLYNVTCMNIKSPDALYKITGDYGIEIFNKKVCFWLDAHWVLTPLNDEIKYITENYKNYTIYIDDFTVPWNENFKNDGFTIEGIKPFIANKNNIGCYMPNYPDTSPECNVATSWTESGPPVGYCILTTDTSTYDKIPLIKKFDLN